MALNDPTFDYEITDDEYIEAASIELNRNMAPLFEFWGIIPTNGLVQTLSSYAPDNRIRDRILYYRSIVPMDINEFQVVYDSITSTIEQHHVDRYDDMLQTYNTAVADSIVLRIDSILCRYYNWNCNLISVDELDEPQIELYPNPTKNTVTISGLSSNYNVILRDPLGRIVNRYQAKGNRLNIDLSGFSSGVYLLEVLNRDAVPFHSDKIIKQ